MAVAQTRAVPSAALEAHTMAIANCAEVVYRTLNRAVRAGEATVADALLMERDGACSRARVGTQRAREADAALITQRSCPVA